MKICANISLLYSERPFLERFEAAANDGFKAVEIQFPYDTPISLIQEQLTKHNLTCVLINVPVGDLMQGGEGLAGVPARAAQYGASLVECLAYARALKVSCVNVLIGRCSDENKRIFHLETFRQNLIKTADILAPFGIVTTFEALNTRDMPGFLIHNLRQSLEILRDVNHPSIKIQLDVYHMALMNQNFDAFLRKHADKVGHIQFADVPHRGEPGSGTLDFPAIFQCITESGYSGWVSAEYKPSKPTSKTLDWLHDLQSTVSEERWLE